MTQEGSAALGQTIGRGWLWSGGSLVIGAALSIVTTGLMVDNAPAQSYGNYAASMTAILLIAFVGRLGVERLTLRELALEPDVRHPDALHKAGSLISLTVLLALAVSGACLAVGVVVVRTSTIVAALASLWVAAELMRPVFIEAARARLDLQGAAIAGPGGRATVMVATALTLFWFDRATLPYLLGIGLMGSFVPLLYLAVKSAASDRLRLPFTLSGALEVLRVNRHTLTGFAIVGAAALIIASGDLLVVRSFGTATDAAAYGAAIALAGAVGMVSTSVNVAVSPVIRTITEADDEQATQQLLRTYVGVGVVLGGVAVAVGIFLAAWVLPRLGGEAYDETPKILAVLAAGQMVGIAAGPCGTILLLSGRERYVANVGSAVAICAAAGQTIAFVLTDSLLFVAIISALAVVVYNVVLMFRTHEEHQIWTSAQLSRAGLRNLRQTVR